MELKFVTLDISNNKYLSWICNVKIHLDIIDSGATIKEITPKF